MSSVQDYEKCPQCGGVYVVEFNCRTYEEYKFCHRCGKTEEYSIVRNDDGEPILDENGAPKYESKDNDGYGCICFAGKKGISVNYSFSEPIDLEELKATYLKTLEDPDIDAETSYFVYWDTEKKEIIVLFGYDPGTYRDFGKSIDENEAFFNGVENKEEHMKTYSKLIGISDNTRKELNSIEDVAQFICTEGLTSDIRIEHEDGSLLLDTFGTYINRITDMEYREELLKILVPMQKKLDGSDGCCDY